jgi:cyclase
VHSTLIVARMEPDSGESVAGLFAEFDRTDMPDRMGTRQRELFHYRGLYFHLQSFDDDQGGEVIEATRNHPRFIQISDDLKQFITPYDPATWRTPKDAMATPFYHWSAR